MVVEKYSEHELDSAFATLSSMKRDMKELELRDYQTETSKHFKEEFIKLSDLVTEEYRDMIRFDRQVKNSDWKLQKDKKNFKVSSIKEGTEIAILMETTIEVPFENFIAVIFAPETITRNPT